MHTHTRSNTTLELTVRYGVVLDHALGAVHAWTFMANNGVHISVILRVLSSPEHNRGADKAALGICSKSEHLHRLAEANRNAGKIQL